MHHRMSMKQKLLFGLLIALFSAITVEAQQKQNFFIASFEHDPFDTTPQNKLYEKIDGSGSRYAIIKVTSNNPDENLKEYNFNFGNLRSIVEEHDGELWVYVQKNAKMVTITRDGYNTISKYDLQTTIEEGQTYLMSITSAQAVVYTQVVQFVVRPSASRATIRIKSTNLRAEEVVFGTVDSTGTVVGALEYGTYTYRVTANDFYSSEGRFTLNDKMKIYKEEVTLRPQFAEVTLDVNANADIYIDNEKMGTRTWTGNLRPGNYQIECRQKGHKYTRKNISVSEGVNQTIQLDRPLANNTGYIEANVQAGTLMGFGADAGFYLSGFNMEAYVTKSMNSESVYLNSTSGTASQSVSLSGLLVGGKIGYGIFVGKRFRITPQAGIGYLSVTGGGVSTNALSGTVGARMEMTFGKIFGVSLTPEGMFAISKKSIFEEVSSVSSKIKGWGTGANIRIGIFAYF